MNTRAELQELLSGGDKHFRVRIVADVQKLSEETPEVQRRAFELVISQGRATGRTDMDAMALTLGIEKRELWDALFELDQKGVLRFAKVTTNPMPRMTWKRKRVKHGQ